MQEAGTEGRRRENRAVVSHVGVSRVARRVFSQGLEDGMGAGWAISEGEAIPR